MELLQLQGASLLRSLNATSNLLVIIKVIYVITDTSFTFGFGREICENSFVVDLGGDNCTGSDSEVLVKQLVIIAATCNLVVTFFVISMQHKKMWRVGRELIKDKIYRESLVSTAGQLFLKLKDILSVDFVHQNISILLVSVCILALVKETLLVPLFLKLILLLLRFAHETISWNLHLVDL